MADHKVVKLEEADSGNSANESEGREPLAFRHRESQELVVALSGAVGCGTRLVVKTASELLANRGYEVCHIKLSKFIELCLSKSIVALEQEDFDSEYERLQLGGNELRSRFRPAVLAEFAIAWISSHRIQVARQSGAIIESVSEIVPGRVAYIVDQLKHPDELHLLRSVYGNLLYVVGILASEEQRRRNLRRLLKEQQVVSVMQRDRRDQEEHGQQLESTLKHADFFLRNNYDNVASIEKPLNRFFDLMHGATSVTPTNDEYAMYAAQSAALKSACLSRQVGAAVTSEDGTVVATGCNDVPKAGGGLYTVECGDRDHRCFRLEGGKCFNDEEKDRLKDTIEQILLDAGLHASDASKAATEIRSTSRVKDLIEFSRSVHAEMDALISVARKGGVSVSGGKLYTTTFPCHNCARHIVAAGITHVYYIEPYEKSLALQLHSDAIASDSIGTGNEDGDPTRVKFLHFEGVSPKQYQNLFYAKEPRKKGGKAVTMKATVAPKSLFQFLDTYRDLESKVVKDLEDQRLLDVLQESE